MKKIIFCLILCGFSMAQAQEAEGSKKLVAFAAYGLSYGGTSFTLGGQYFVSPRFCVGGIYNRGSYEDQVQLNYRYNFNKRTITSIGVRGEFHFKENAKKSDLYIAGTLGSSSVVHEDASRKIQDNTSLLIGADLGFRYYIAESFGLMIEIGGGTGILKGGACLRF